MAKPDPLSLEQQLCFALYTASRALTSRYRPLLDELGITYPQYLVMLALYERGRISVKELGAALQLDSGTLSPLLKRMEAAGLVRRTRRTDDERSVQVELTEHGQALKPKVRAVPRAVYHSLGSPAGDLIALHGQLSEFVGKLNPSD